MWSDTFVLFTPLVPLMGIMLAHVHHEWMLFARSGALLVVIAIAFAWARYHWLRLLEKAITASLNGEIPDATPQDRKEFEAAVEYERAHLFGPEYLIAVVGTLIWGFGDLAGPLLDPPLSWIF